MKTKHLYYFVIATIIIAGCHTKKAATKSKKTTAPAVSALQQINAKWQLEELNGYPLEKDKFDIEKPNIEIQTQTKLYFGYTGCNRMNGEMLLTETTIEFKPGAMTRMSCLDGGNIETDFLKALKSSKHYSIEHGKLALKNGEQKVVCKFRKVD